MNKKMLLSLSMLLFTGLLWFNMQQVKTQTQSGTSEITMSDLEIMQVVAQAEVGCSLQEHDCISGTDCYVTHYVNNDAEYIFTFDFGLCIEFCDTDGSNCCFGLSSGCF